jgi:hypothetical protein
LGNVTLDEALIEFDLVTGEGRPAAPGPPDVMTDVDRGRLDVLVSGPLPPDPGEFVATQRLADILTALRNRYDIVVLDSPPLLRVGDAMTLSARADGLIVLTRLTTARRPMLRELGRIVESAPTTKIGYVVTGVPVKGALHLKSVCTALPDGTLLVDPSAVALEGIAIAEPGSANVVCVGDEVVMSSAYPRTAEIVARHAKTVHTVPLGEFAKADGCATCLSLVFTGG